MADDVETVGSADEDPGDGQPTEADRGSSEAMDDGVSRSPLPPKSPGFDGDFQPLEDTSSIPQEVAEGVSADSALRAKADGGAPLRALILASIANLRQDQVDVSAYGLGQEEFKGAYRAVVEAHPSLFYANAYCQYWYYPSTGRVTSFRPSYSVERLSDVPSLRREFDDALADMMSWVPADGTDLQKVKAVHDWMCRKVSYDYDSYNSGSYKWCDHNAYGALVRHSCVCAGYAYAFRAAMTRLGIPCTYVSANNHAWNRVRVGDSWYHVDTTWDASWTGSASSTSTIWFMKSDAGIQAQDRRYSSYYRSRGEVTHSGYAAAGEVAGTDTRYDGWGDASFPSYSGTLATNRVTFYRLRDVELVMGPNEEADVALSSITPANANRAMAVWTSSDPAVACVMSDGHVASGGILGTAKMDCRVGTVHISCNVRVAKPLSGAAIAAIPTQAWTGRAVTPAPVVTLAGTSGQGLRLEALCARLGSGAGAGGIRYRAHVQNVGWQGWVRDGATAGTTGRGLRVEAVQVELTGRASSAWDVYYRVHVQDLGWLGWARNGGTSGTTGMSKRVEAVQVALVSKGGPAPGPTTRPCVVGSA